MKKNFLVIAGMHRSGTSFLARALNLKGVYLGNFESLTSDDWRPSEEDTLRGHWENRTLLDLTEKTFSYNTSSWDAPP